MSDYSISMRLHDFLKARKIIGDVALKMGYDSFQRLSMELRPNLKSAKLGADELVPLFRAVRELGYERELDGILSEFTDMLRSGATTSPVERDPILIYVELQRAMSAVSEATGNVLDEPTEDRLLNAANLISTQLLSCLISVRMMLDEKLEFVRHQKRESAKAASG